MTLQTICLIIGLTGYAAVNIYLLYRVCKLEEKLKQL